MCDDAPTPPTLSDLAYDVSAIICWCNRCHHCGVVPIGELLSRLGPALPFPMVHGRLRCQACGSKDIHARPDWPKLGQVAGHGPSKEHGSSIEELADDPAAAH